MRLKRIEVGIDSQGSTFKKSSPVNSIASCSSLTEVTVAPNKYI